MCPVITVAYYVFQVFMLKIKNVFCHSVLFHNTVKCYTITVHTGSDRPLTRNPVLHQVPTKRSSDTTKQETIRYHLPEHWYVLWCMLYLILPPKRGGANIHQQLQMWLLDRKNCWNVKKRISSAWSINKRCLHFLGSQDAAWTHCDSFNGSCFLAGMLWGKLS